MRPDGEALDRRRSDLVHALSGKFNPENVSEMTRKHFQPEIRVCKFS